MTRLGKALRDLQTRHIHRLTADEARQENEEDETLRAVLDLVQREFCDSERGKARASEIRKVRHRRAKFPPFMGSRKAARARELTAKSL